MQAPGQQQTLPETGADLQQYILARVHRMEQYVLAGCTLAHRIECIEGAMQAMREQLADLAVSCRQVQHHMKENEVGLEKVEKKLIQIGMQGVPLRSGKSSHGGKQSQQVSIKIQEMKHYYDEYRLQVERKLQLEGNKVAALEQEIQEIRKALEDLSQQQQKGTPKQINNLPLEVLVTKKQLRQTIESLDDLYRAKFEQMRHRIRKYQNNSKERRKIQTPYNDSYGLATPKTAQKDETSSTSSYLKARNLPQDTPRGSPNQKTTRANAGRSKKNPREGRGCGGRPSTGSVAEAKPRFKTSPPY